MTLNTLTPTRLPYNKMKQPKFNDNVLTLTDVLTTVPFFAQMQQKDAVRLAKQLRTRTYHRNETLFRLGDESQKLYIIVSGKIKITQSNNPGQEMLLTVLGRGDFFGELALIDEQPHSATATAISPTTVLTLERSIFQETMASSPEFGQQILLSISKRVRELNDQVANVFFLDLPTRIGYYLLNLAEKHGEQIQEGIMINVYLTQTDIAEMSGATRVSINKILGRFKQQGLLLWLNRRMVITDIQAMETFIETNRP